MSWMRVDTRQSHIWELERELARLRGELSAWKMLASSPVEVLDRVKDLEAEVESLKAIIYQKDVLTDSAAQANNLLRERARKAEAVVRVAELKRNTRWEKGKEFEGEWTVIPTEDFDRLCEALAAIRQNDEAVSEL